MTEDFKNKVARFADMLKKSERIVFFGGAGVSTESGIPDFRSTDGIYNQKYDYPPEVILSHEFFSARTDEFYKFYRDKMIYKKAKPNVTHRALKKLEDAGKLSAIVTQNIDGLHEIAGCKNVYALHGTIYKNHCERCGKKFGLDAIEKTAGVPKCECGGVIKPDVVLYGESLPADVTLKAVDAIKNADMLIVGGTSLAVYPAASFVNYYKGERLVLINLQPTDYDGYADIVFRNKLGEVFSAIEF